jgi:hypothetical protein
MFAALLVGTVLAVVSVAPSRDAIAQAPPAGVLASAEFSNDPNLRCDILEVKRVSGGALNIRWRIVNTTGQPGGLTGAQGKPIGYSFGCSSIRRRTRNTPSSRIPAATASCRCSRGTMRRASNG